MTIPRFLASLLLAMALTGSAGAQQIFIKNQPFAGKVVREQGGYWLELAPLERALGFSAKVETDGARVDGRLVRVMKQGDVVLVPLSQVASAIGAVVRDNPEFGTVDVYVAMKPVAGAGLDVDTSTGSEAPGTAIKTAAYSFSVPEGMQVSRDPRLINAYFASGGSRSPSEAKIDALVYYKGDTKFKKGAAVFSWMGKDVPKEMQAEDNLLAFQYQVAKSIFDESDVAAVQAPNVVENEGQKFILTAGVSKAAPFGGTMILLRIDAKRKRWYQVMAGNISQKEEQPTKDFLQLLTTVQTR